MVDKTVWQPQLHNPIAQTQALQGFQYGTADTAHDCVLLQRHQHFMRLRQLPDERFVQWFHKAHVGQRGVECFCRCQRGGDQAAKRQQCHRFAGATHDAFTDWQGVHGGFNGGTISAAARVTHRARAIQRHRGVEHLAAFVFVRRGHYRHIGNATQVTQIKAARMGRAIGSHQPGAVNRQHDRQILQGDIVNQLVIGALQKRRINRHYRFVAIARQTGSKGQRVLFGDADVKIAVGKFLGETYQARTLAHRRGNADQPRFDSGHVTQPVAEHLRVGGFGDRLFDNAGCRIEAADTVIQAGVVLCRFVAFALARDDMQKLRAVEALDVC